MTSLFRTAPLFIAIGGTAELCFLARLLIKAVTPPHQAGKLPPSPPWHITPVGPWWRRRLSAFDVAAREKPPTRQVRG